MEAILGAISKFGWILIAAFIGQQFYEKRRDKARLDDTYTKKETEQQIDLRMKPLQNELRHVVDSLRLTVESNDRLTMAINKLTTDVEVIKVTKKNNI